MLRSKNLTKPCHFTLPAKTIHELQQCSEDEVSVNQRQQVPLKTTEANKTTTQLTTEAKSKRDLEIKREKLNKRFKRIQTPIDLNVSKQLD